MKKNLYQLLTALALVLLAVSCRKDQAHEQYTEPPPFIKPDLSIKITSSVAGFVTNENNEPVYGAKVLAGNKQATTDEYGYFNISNALLPEAAAFVKISFAGYFDGYETFTPKTGKETLVRVKLLPKNNAGTVDATTGGTVSLSNGARVILPASSVVLASSGGAYTGTVSIAVQWLDPSDASTQQQTAPGDDRGLDTDGHLAFVRSFGTVAVELTGSGGQLLQVAGGKKATINIPIPASMNGAAPSSIALWSFDETSGLWKQEAAATKAGNTYTGEVSHFSFWNGATGIPLVNVTAQVVDASLNPLVNTAVGIRFAGQSFAAGGGTYARTDINGVVTGAVPANTSLVLSVLTPCYVEAYSHSFTTANSSVDLGTISGNMGQGLVTIKGNVVDCNGQPVTNGYMQTFDNGLFNRIPIINGAFTFTGVGCTNMVTNLVVADNNANQQSDVQTVTLVTGMNNLGTLHACGTSTVGTITYTIDGVTRTLTEPANTLAGYFTNLNGWSAIIDIIPAPGTSNINFQFDGGTALGSAHKLSEVFCVGFPSGRAIAPTQLNVTITEYGSPGGFISGQFSGQMLDFPTNSPHNVSCEFRVRRIQ